MAERIRRALPAFAELSDRQVLEAPFTLALAHQVIAREHGFADWTQLKRSLEEMSVSRSEPESTTIPRTTDSSWGTPGGSICGTWFHQPYREQPWSAHDFIVADPDGNLIHFASIPGEP